MTTYRLGMDQTTWEEEKKKLLPQPPKAPISLLPGSGGTPKVNTLDTHVPVRLDVHHIDVGQGESTLFTLMAGAVCLCSVLIDCGLALEGGGLLVRLLHRLSVQYLDAVIISHFDLDHCEGLVRILKQFEAFGEDDKPTMDVDKGEDWKSLSVQKVFLRDSPTNAKSTKATTAIEEALGQYNEGAIILAETGDEIILDCNADQGLFKMTCLSVNAGNPDGSDFENAASIAWLVELGKYTYYTAGDLPSEDEGTKIEDALGPTIKAKWGPLTAVKCGHHGAETSTSAAFLGDVKPWLAFISAGKQDGFGHPRTKTLVSLYNQPSVGLVFMTNCFYNRPWVNDDYVDQAYATLKQLVGDASRQLRGLASALPDPPERAKAAKSGDAGNLAKFVTFRKELVERRDAVKALVDALAASTGDAVTAQILADIRSESSDLDDLVRNDNKDTQQAVWPLGRGYEVTGSGSRQFLQFKGDFKKQAKAIQDCMHDAVALTRDLEDARTALGTRRSAPFHTFVAGGVDYMGNVVLRFFVDDCQKDARVAFVGLHDNSQWRWMSLRFGDIDPSTIRLPTDSYLSLVDARGLGRLLTPGSPSREEGSKKKSYESRAGERGEKRKAVQPSITDRSTVIKDWEGTQDRAKKTKVVPPPKVATVSGTPTQVPKGENS